MSIPNKLIIEGVDTTLNSNGKVEILLHCESTNPIFCSNKYMLHYYDSSYFTVIKTSVSRNSKSYLAILKCLDGSADWMLDDEYPIEIIELIGKELILIEQKK